MNTGDPRWGGDPVPPVVLCIGPERWLKDRAVRDLKRRCLSGGFEEADFLCLDGPASGARMIVDSVRTAPLGSPRRLVVAEGWEEIGPDSEPWVAKYLADPALKGCLVLCAERVGRSRSAPIPPQWRNGNPPPKTIWCLPLKGAALEEWIVRRAQEQESRLADGTTALLVRRVGTDLQGLDAALEMLRLFSDPAGPIRPSDVEELIPPSYRETAFDLLDLAGSGRLGPALQSLRRALADGTLQTEQFIGALSWYYRMAWNSRRGAGSEGWRSPQRRSALDRIGRWPQERMSGAMEEVLRAAMEIRRGHPSPGLLTDRLLIQMGR